MQNKAGQNEDCGRKLTLFVAGATGKTGGPLVAQALGQGHSVRAVVRSLDKLPAAVREHPSFAAIEAAVLDLSDAELAEAVHGCDAVVSCLGHVISFRGIYGAPRQLCTEATRRLCTAIVASRPATPVRFVLMNSVGVSNAARAERRTWGERCVLTLLRWLVPPHKDNEDAAQRLHKEVGRDNAHVAWCIVRPDALINGEVSAYEITESPVTGIFSGRPTTRANVAHFMLGLVEDDETWRRWRFDTPVIMNAEAGIAAVIDAPRRAA